MANLPGPRKVLFLEFNEITWTIIDPMIQKGKLPNLARIRREGTWTSPESVDQPPYLDPWITWVTVHTGVDRSVHGATVLEQEEGTIHAKRTWQYAVEAGKTIGVFGSISAYPPRPVPGFMVPGPFSPSSDTYPRYVEPIQALNRKYTQVHHKNSKQDSALDMALQGAELLKLGLKPSTCAAIAAQLVRERIEPHLHWRRVSLQPLINYDFFDALYRRYRPDFATWHTNHAAHYMHHYWRAMDDSKFPVPAPPEEKRKYGGAVEYGYEVCDELLGRFMKLIDDDTVLVLASSMGQQPFVADLYPEGKIVVRFKDIHKVLDIIGAKGVTEVVPTMVPQWNVKIHDEAERTRVKGLLERAEMKGGVRPVAFHIAEVGDILTVTPYGMAKREGDIRYFFPDAPNADPKGYSIDELFVMDAPSPKEGMHHPTGIFILWGKGIRAGVEIKNTTNLDIAPTVLSLLGIPAPSLMKGRVLSEAWSEAPAASSRGDERPVVQA
jgi:hypothetical protein